MRVRPFHSFLLIGVLFSLIIAAIPARSVSAQDCYDPQTQQKVPCEKEKKKKPTETPVPTKTPEPQAAAPLPPINPPAAGPDNPTGPNSGPAMPSFFDFGGGISLSGILIGLLVGVLIGLLVPAVFRGRGELAPPPPGIFSPTDGFQKMGYMKYDTEMGPSGTMEPPGPPNNRAGFDVFQKADVSSGGDHAGYMKEMGSGDISQGDADTHPTDEPPGPPGDHAGHLKFDTEMGSGGDHASVLDNSSHTEAGTSGHASVQDNGIRPTEQPPGPPV